MFRDKVLLITGGTGSFGSTILRQFVNSDLREIRVFSRGERKQEELRMELNSKKIKFIIGDIREAKPIKEAMYGVDYVFHAAALKQVPACEENPMEAINTNVTGAGHVLKAAAENHVKRVVALSTDKAVYPVNTMGHTKALMEKLCIHTARSPMVEQNGGVYCCTRYGNVMYSSGSIIPRFIGQIKSGQPLTVTDPDMTRFMMSLDDSVRLVLYAFEHACPGDIFIQKAPAATVGTLVSALKKIFKADNPIEIIGARPGEKMSECLCSREEMVRAEDMGDFYRIPADCRNLATASEGPHDVEYNSDNTRRLDVDELTGLLLSLPGVQRELAHWRR